MSQDALLRSLAFDDLDFDVSSLEIRSEEMCAVYLIPLERRGGHREGRANEFRRRIGAPHADLRRRVAHRIIVRERIIVFEVRFRTRRDARHTQIKPSIRDLGLTITRGARPIRFARGLRLTARPWKI